MDKGIPEKVFKSQTIIDIGCSKHKNQIGYNMFVTPLSILKSVLTQNSLWPSIPILESLRSSLYALFNLNAQDVNGMTPLHLAVHMYGY